MTIFQKAENLQDVKGRISDILKYCEEKESPLGFFAALYTLVANKIEEAIENGTFDNSEKLIRMDVNFVNLYIDAMNCAFSGQDAESHWQIAIDAAKSSKYVVLQHLFLCMNAHINFDLANAVNQTVQKDETLNFKSDFMKVNAILFGLLDEVQENVSNIFHPLKWYLKFGKKLGDKVLSVGMGTMRSEAFSFTCVLALANDNERRTENEIQQEQVVKLSQLIISQDNTWYLKLIVKMVRLMESGTVKDKIENLLK